MGEVFSDAEAIKIAAQSQGLETDTIRTLKTVVWAGKSKLIAKLAIKIYMYFILNLIYGQ